MLSVEDLHEIANSIPAVFEVRQHLKNSAISDAGKVVFEKLCSALKPGREQITGKKIAVTVGSRGIGQLSKIVSGIVSAIKHVGADPCIIPAMGSHGASNPADKKRILAKREITESAVQAPISMTARCCQYGQIGPDLPLYCQEEAFRSDGIIVFNRIKPHTDFRGTIESGLIKMASVGLGGVQGATAIHFKGYDFLGDRVLTAGENAVRLLKIISGVSVIEGADGSPDRIDVINPAEILMREKQLLAKARRNQPSLPIQESDVLVIREIGKEISGLGMDPVVTGRFPSGKIFSGSSLPKHHRIVALDLTANSLGNASGIGLSDITTKKLFKKIDLDSTYRNVIASKGAASARIPMLMQSDQEAICVALKTCPTVPNQARLILIQDTLNIEKFYVSYPLIQECRQNGAIVSDQPLSLKFNKDGNLLSPDFFTC